MLSSQEQMEIIKTALARGYNGPIYELIEQAIIERAAEQQSKPNQPQAPTPALGGKMPAQPPKTSTERNIIMPGQYGDGGFKSSLETGYTDKKFDHKIELGPNEVMSGTPEYAAAYPNVLFPPSEEDEKEGIAGMINIPTVEIVADKETGENILEKYPYYNQLTDEQKKYFRDEGILGRGIRATAMHGEGNYAESVKDMAFGMLTAGPKAAGEILQTPQSLLVESIAKARGEDYNFSDALPTFGTKKNKQRLPSDVIGFEDKPGWDLGGSLNTTMDFLGDPSVFFGVGALNKVKNTSKLFTKGTTKLTSGYKPQTFSGITAEKTAKKSNVVTADNLITPTNKELELINKGMDDATEFYKKESFTPWNRRNLEEMGPYGDQIKRNWDQGVKHQTYKPFTHSGLGQGINTRGSSGKYHFKNVKMGDFDRFIINNKYTPTDVKILDPGEVVPRYTQINISQNLPDYRKLSKYSTGKTIGGRTITQLDVDKKFSQQIGATSVHELNHTNNLTTNMKGYSKVIRGERHGQVVDYDLLDMYTLHKNKDLVYDTRQPAIRFGEGLVDDVTEEGAIFNTKWNSKTNKFDQEFVSAKDLGDQHSELLKMKNIPDAQFSTYLGYRKQPKEVVPNMQAFKYKFGLTDARGWGNVGDDMQGTVMSTKIYDQLRKSDKKQWALFRDRKAFQNIFNKANYGIVPIIGGATLHENSKSESGYRKGGFKKHDDGGVWVDGMYMPNPNLNVVKQVEKEDKRIKEEKVREKALKIKQDKEATEAWLNLTTTPFRALGEVIQTPQSLLTESAAALKGEEYDFSNAFPSLESIAGGESKQRVPSQVIGFENKPVVNFTMDLFADPANLLLGAGIINKATKGSKLLKKTEKAVDLSNSPKLTKIGEHSISKEGFQDWMKYQLPPAKYNTNLVESPTNVYRAVRNPIDPKTGKIDQIYQFGPTADPTKGLTKITSKELAEKTALELNPNVYTHKSHFNVGMSTSPNKAEIQNFYAYRLQDAPGYYGGKKGINPYMKGKKKWDLSYEVAPDQKILGSGEYHKFMTDINAGGASPKTSLLGTKEKADILNRLGYTGIKKFPDSDEIQWLNPKKSLILRDVKEISNLKMGGKRRKCKYGCW